jgi:hypothetical protein
MCYHDAVQSKTILSLAGADSQDGSGLRLFQKASWLTVIGNLWLTCRQVLWLLFAHRIRNYL